MHLIPFPSDTSSAFGFVIDKNTQLELEGKKYTLYLLLGTPNPLMGFLLFYPENTTQCLPWTMEEGVKTVLSAGIVHACYPESLQKKTVTTALENP